MSSPAAGPIRLRRRAVASLLPLALIALASCGDDGDTETIPASGERETTTTEATTTTTAASSTAVGDWTIDSLTTAGTATEAPEGATLSLTEGRVNVATGCNTGMADAEIGDGTVTLGPLGTTMMACEPELMTWETSLVAFLEGELTYEVTDDALTLTRDDSVLTLSAS